MYMYMCQNLWQREKLQLIILENEKKTIKYVIMFFCPTGLSDLTNFLETFQVLADFLE